MSYNIFERVQKCWMVFPTFLMKFTMFDGLHRLLTCDITFVQLCSKSIRSISLKFAVSRMRNSWIIFQNASLCFRLFIQDRVLRLVFTSSLSSRRKEIIASTTRLSAILLFVFLSCIFHFEWNVRGVVQAVQTWYMTCSITCHMTCFNGLPQALEKN